LGHHVGIPILIVVPRFVGIVHGAVALNYELCLMAVEVGDVVAILMLTSEFESKQLPIPQQLPQQLFSRRLLSP